MRTASLKKISSAFLACFAVLTMVCEADRWFVSLYGGKFSDNALLDILRLQTDFGDSYLYALSVGKQIGQYKDKISYELEGQVAVHSGRQSHREVNGAFTLRWLPFPWDRHLDTSIALGNGLSYATKEPPLEIQDSDDNRSSQWLYFILVELAFCLPGDNPWELFTRVHHRSGVFGLIHGVDSGSNFIGLGLRYRF
jgi:hypothetical protein